MNSNRRTLLNTLLLLPLTSCASRAPLKKLETLAMLPVSTVDYHVLDRRDVYSRIAIEKHNDHETSHVLDEIVVPRDLPAVFNRKFGALVPPIHNDFDRALRARLQTLGIPLQQFASEKAPAIARKNDTLAQLGATVNADAVIDVQIAALGYRPYVRGNVVTPESYVELNVVRVSDGYDLDGAQYSFDRRKYLNDSRHFRCEIKDTFPSVDALMKDLPAAAKILERGTMLMVNRVAEDILEIFQGKALL